MSIRELRGRPLVLTVSSLTSLGFMLIGYDNGLMGGLVNSPAFNRTFNSPNPKMIGLIVAIFEIGCFFGSITTAIFGENLGRRRTVGHGCWIMIVGAILQAASFSCAQLIVGRIVSGFGLGIVNSTVPVLQAEFSPKASRGIYVCAQLSMLNFGIFLVYWIDYAFFSHSESFAWRVPVILQCCCIIPIIVMIRIIPETPRWLAAHDRPDECLKVLARMQSAPPSNEEVRRVHNNILKTVAFAASVGSGSWKDLLKNDSLQSQTRLLIACAIQSFQQLGGINALIYYTHTLFQASIGFSPRMSSLMSGFLQTWFFVASFIPWLLIDRIGRKPLFLSMISVMAGVMAVQAGLIYQVENKTPIAHNAAIGAAVMFLFFRALLPSDSRQRYGYTRPRFFPLRLRQRGSSLSTAANWIFNYMIVQITPIAIENIGWRTYIIFAVLNTLWIPIIFFFFPETKGLELEDVDRLFAGQDFLGNASDDKSGGTATVEDTLHGSKR